jgi:hypothetical protein
MAIDRKTASNRRNSAKSTGPKSEAGKARSALNAVSHGLFAKSAFDAVAQNKIDELATSFAQGKKENQALMDAAREAAENQVILERIRDLRTQVWKTSAHDRSITGRGELYALNDPGNAQYFLEHFGASVGEFKKLFPNELTEPFSSDIDRDAAIVDLATKELAKLVRYERQAANRRDRALRAMEQLSD